MDKQIAKHASKWLGVIFWINMVKLLQAALSIVFPVIWSAVSPWFVMLLFAAETVCVFKCVRADENFRIAGIYALVAFVISQAITWSGLFDTNDIMEKLSEQRALLESVGSVDPQTKRSSGELILEFARRFGIVCVILLIDGLICAMRDYRLFRGLSRVTEPWDEKLPKKWKSVWKGYLACWIILAVEAVLVFAFIHLVGSLLADVGSLDLSDDLILLLMVISMLGLGLAVLIIALITYIRHLKYLHRTVKLLRDV